MKKTVCLVPRKNAEKFCADMREIGNKTAEKEAPDYAKKGLVRIIVTRDIEGCCPLCRRAY